MTQEERNAQRIDELRADLQVWLDTTPSIRHPFYVDQRDASIVLAALEKTKQGVLK